MAHITTEEVREIRNELKYRFGNQLKFSVRKEHHSSVNVIIKSGKIDFSDVLGDREYITINQYTVNQTDVYANLFNEIFNIIKTAPARTENGREWYDNSDSMTDYFDTAFYFHLKIGDFENPYQFTGQKKKKTPSNEKYSIPDKNRSSDVSNDRFSSFKEAESQARLMNAQTAGNSINKTIENGVIPFAEKNYYVLNQSNEIMSFDKDHTSAQSSKKALEEALNENLTISEVFPTSKEMEQANILSLDSFDLKNEHIFSYIFDTPETMKIFNKNNCISLIPSDKEVLDLLDMNNIDYTVTSNPITKEAKKTLQNFLDNVSDYFIVIDTHDSHKVSEIILREKNSSESNLEEEFKTFI